MSLAGEEKEMRMPGSLGYHSLDQNTDQGGNHVHPSNIQDHEKSTGGGGATPAGTGVAPYNSAGGITGSNKFNKVSSRAARYRECLKNHAANIGGNVTDGCGEFMPSGEEGTLEALKCAACNCHRNFHRKEQNIGGGDNNNNAGIMVVHPLQLPQPLPSPIPSLNHHHHHQHGGRSIWTTMPPQPVKMAFGGSGGSGATDSSSEELNFNTYHHQQATSVPPQPQPPFVLAKKRFRTKFSQEQKDKMLEFAEKLGWRIPREDDTEVQRFCSQVGVKRQVFKVWMHNNKNPSAKKNTLQEDQQP
ncbi:Zinc-finger homeodomain protein 6 [Capsicum chinense]|uniref:zinc-finger homeodomain protein 6 n=1 Tax=Capsicum annuum TaxID=4072 RepID=UPI0007BEDB4D|nr:zinc-finger homeodomain protein 6 [Capsicum annuum]KAF3640197.1 Zinc-finger homeodomain protein 6 [Capsicum annuum]PHT98827.1 Zinc-finger homeodomain protein 6 [Capsicum chinense]